MTGFNIEPVFYAKAYIPSWDIGVKLLREEELVLNLEVLVQAPVGVAEDDVASVVHDEVHGGSFQSRVFNILEDSYAGKKR